MIDISFLVVCYNQKDYIIYALDSIRHQVSNYLRNYSIQLVVADDASEDGTFELIRNWINRYHDIFDEVDIVRNNTNRGVRANLLNGVRKAEGMYCKILAGDDLLPVESILPFFEQLKTYDIVMGLPLYFSGKYISREYRNDSITHRIREKIDGKHIFIDRIEKDCFLHSPSVYLRTNLISDDRVSAFMRRFRFLDDYPMWYAIAIYNPKIKYCFLDRVAILYRRTNKSAIFIREKSIIMDRRKLALIIRNNSGVRIYTKFTKWNEAFAASFGNRFALKYLIFNNYVEKIRFIVMRLIKYRKFEQYDFWRRENNTYLEELASSVNAGL